MATPVRRAPINGYEGDTPDDLNQLLGTPAEYIVLDNATAIITPDVSQFDGFQLFAIGAQGAPTPVAYDQPVALSGAIDRVVLPLSIATGSGADLHVSLFADSAGVPTGLPIAKTYVPRQALSVPTPAANKQTSPASYGQQMLQSWVSQPPLPVALQDVGIASDGTTVVVVGGTADGTTAVATVYTANVDANGNIIVWNISAALPVALMNPGVAIFGETVIVAGGLNGSTYQTAVYIGTIADGAIAAWTTGTDLPVAVANNACACDSAGVMYSVAGTVTGGGATGAVYYCPISDGAMGAWTITQPVPADAGMWAVAIGQQIYCAGVSAFTAACQDGGGVA